MVDRTQPSAMALRIALLTGPHVGARALRRRAEKIDGMLRTAKSIGAALGSAAGAVFTGIRAFIAMG